MLNDAQTTATQSMIATAWGCDAADIRDQAGLTRIMIASALIHPAIRVHVLALESDLNSADFHEKPLALTNLVGSIIAELPILLLSENAFVGRWDTNGLACALSTAAVNPVFLALGSAFCAAGLSFARLRQADGKRRLETWEFDRVRQLRYAQHADCGLEGVVPEGFSQLLANIPEKKQRRFRPTGFYFSPPVRVRSGSTLDAKIRAELGGNPAREKRAIRVIAEAEDFDANTQLAEAMAAAADKIAAATPGKPHSVSPFKNSLRNLYVSAVPAAGGIGPAEVELLIGDLMSILPDTTCKDWQAAATLAICMSVWALPEHLRGMKVLDSGNLVSTEVSRRVTTVPDATLHRPIENCFVRPIPLTLVGPLLRLQEVGISEYPTITSFLESRNSLVTFARVTHALEYTCPDAFQYHPILAMTGLDPTAQKIPAPRSYIWLGKRVCGSATAWWRLFDPAFEMPARRWSACGSPFVPRSEVIRGFVRVILSLFEAAIPNEDLVQERKAVNAMAAGLHLLGVVFLGGIRNYPMSIPQRIAISGGWLLGKQKGIHLLTWPDGICPLLAKYQSRRHLFFQECQSAGIKYRRNEEIDTAYGLYFMEKGRVVSEGICARSIAVALLACDDTAEWSTLYPGALRHLAMSELYACGQFRSHDIESFHHRGFRELQSLNASRMEDPRAPRATATMRQHLMEFIGL